MYSIHRFNTLETDENRSNDKKETTWLASHALVLISVKTLRRDRDARDAGHLNLKE